MIKALCDEQYAQEYIEQPLDPSTVFAEFEHLIPISHMSKLRGSLHDLPLHPYTQALLSAMPVSDPDHELGRQRIILEGDVPDPADPPPARRFHTRYAYATDICRQEDPEFRDLGVAGSPKWSPATTPIALCSDQTRGRLVGAQVGSGANDLFVG
jgi:oligopeptide/dipeptide ABC transporter ATP-binding protein